jgi:hypothetical protein
MNRSQRASELHVSYQAQSCGVSVGAPLTILCAILFLSGIGALIFETLWLRLSGLAFGNSVWATALILSSFMGGLALGNDRCIIENSPMATAPSLRFAEGTRRSAWLHNRFWPSRAWRIDAPRVANAVELSANPPWATVHCVLPDSTCANNGYGTDASGVDRRFNVAANQFWPRDWFSVWLEHVRRSGWRCARRRLSHPGVWPSRHQFGCRFGELHRRNNRLFGSKNWRHYGRANSPGNVSAALRCKLSAATPEYFMAPQQFQTNDFPPPNWMLPVDQREDAVNRTSAWWRSNENHESGESPLYYAIAGSWLNLGRVVGITGASLLYWVRFFNVFVAGTLVWMGFLTAKFVFPDRQFVHFSVPILLPVWPQTTFYSIQSDLLSPLCFGIAFIGLVKILQA